MQQRHTDRAPQAPATPAASGLWQRAVDRLRRDAAQAARRWRGESDRRGMVLIMTMLMMTMLTLLGSAAVMQTTNDIRDAGAHRVERAVFRIAEAATMGAVGMAGTMGSRFDDYAAGKSNTITQDDFGDTLLDLGQAGTGSFGRELNSMGKPGFTITVEPPQLSTAVAGYESGKYCFQSYRMVTRGRIGDPAAKTERERALAGEAGLAAQVVIGPVRCNN